MKDTMSAKAVLSCRPNSHPFQDRSFPLEQPVKIGRSVARSRPNGSNAIFDCKVLSRNHALLWYENGKFFLQDTKSSNGTFVNNQRLSKSSEESLPFQVSSGDILQFGVDVMEVTKKDPTNTESMIDAVTHGCIVATLQLYLPDGKEAKASSSTQLMEKSQTSVHEMYQINQVVKEAMQREQIIDTKLASLAMLIGSTKTVMATSWKAMIDEDRLLGKVDSLQRQLHTTQKGVSEDKLKEEITQLHDDKEKYQLLAKQKLKELALEKLEIVKRVSELERTLDTTENEHALLKEISEILAESREEVRRLQIENAAIQDRANSLGADLADYTNKYDVYKTQAENLEESNNEQRQQALILNEKIFNSEKLCAELQKEITYNQEEISTKENMILQLKGELSALAENRTDQDERMALLRSQINDLSNEGEGFGTTKDNEGEDFITTKGKGNDEGEGFLTTKDKEDEDFVTTKDNNKDEGFITTKENDEGEDFLTTKDKDNEGEGFEPSNDNRTSFGLSNGSSSPPPSTISSSSSSSALTSLRPHNNALHNLCAECLAPVLKSQANVRGTSQSLAEIGCDYSEEEVICGQCHCSRLESQNERLLVQLAMVTSKLQEAEEELSIYKDQFNKSSSDCSKLEKQLLEEQIIVNRAHWFPLRYMVPVLIILLAILIAFHPNSSMST